MATKKQPVVKKPTAKAPAKPRGLTKPVPLQPKPATMPKEPVSEEYTPQFTGKSFMQRAQSSSL